MRRVPLVWASSALVVAAVGAWAAHCPIVDPGLAYYSGRSAESIVEEIRANGYEEVRIACANESGVKADLLTAFHAARFKVWMLAFCNGVYPRADLPEGWEAWRMKVGNDEQPKLFTYLCPNNQAYRDWKKHQLTAALTAHAFHGVVLGEPFLAADQRPGSQTHGCLCETCVAAFKKMYSDVDAPPEFADEASANYWKTNATLCEKWDAFRVASVVAFLDDIVNGSGGIRHKCPNVRIATWSLAASEAAAIVKRVRPDCHVLQTEWPTWTERNLPASYPQRYKAVVDAVREASGQLPILLAADVGSQQDSRRTRSWLRDLDKAASGAGFGGVECYEYSLGDWNYTEPPTVLEAVREPAGIRVVFNKRVEAISASSIANYTLTSGRVDYAKVDGAVVHLAVSGAGGSVSLLVSGIVDDEASRLFHDKPQRVMERPIRLEIAEPVDNSDSREGG